MNRISQYQAQAQALHQEWQDFDAWKKETWMGYLFGGLAFYPWRYHFAHKEERLLNKWVKEIRKDDYQAEPTQNSQQLESLKQAHKALYGSLRHIEGLTQEILQGPAYIDLATKQITDKRPKSTRAICNEIVAKLQHSQDPVEQKILQRYRGYLSQLDNNQTVVLPKYFHTTKPQALTGIIKDQRVEARWLGAFFGTWVSTLPEVTTEHSKGYGNSAIAFGGGGVDKDTDVACESCRVKTPSQGSRLHIGRLKDLKIKKDGVAYIAVPHPESWNTPLPCPVISIDEAKREAKLLLEIRPQIAPDRWHVTKI